MKLAFPCRSYPVVNEAGGPPAGGEEYFFAFLHPRAPLVGGGRNSAGPGLPDAGVFMRRRSRGFLRALVYSVVF